MEPSVERSRTALAGHPILQGLDAAALDAIAARALWKSYDAGTVLTRDGEPAWAYWLLLGGSVRVFYRSPEGLEVTVKLFAAPAAWAEMQVLHSYIHTEDCVAVDRATVACLRKADFEALLDLHPRFMKNVLLDAGARFLIATQHERALAFLSVPARLAHLLLSYVRLYGVPVEGGVMIRARLSQDELANGLGVARKSIVRTFQEWAKDGVLEKRGVHYVVTDVEKLAARAPTDLVGIDWRAGGTLKPRGGAER
jgi:CRP-like cAMP-binding protein